MKWRARRPPCRLEDGGPNLPIGTFGKLVAHIILDHLGRAIGVGRQLLRRLSRERDAEGGIAQRRHDARTPIGRRVLDQAGEVQRIRYAENETNYCPTCQTEGRLLADRSLSRLLKDDWPRSLDELEERRAGARADST